ncbi:hypothetical protein [Geopseudomonas aromaticivorans]
MTTSTVSARMNAAESETLQKAADGAALLLDDLRALAKASDPLLAEIAIDLLQQTAGVERKLRRLNLIARD